MSANEQRTEGGKWRVVVAAKIGVFAFAGLVVFESEIK
jgi:hypothetical protein